MTKNYYQNKRFRNAQATPRKLNHTQEKTQIQYRRLFYGLMIMVSIVSLISISDPLIKYMTAPKKVKVIEKKIASLKTVNPLPKDHPSLPKSYGYETVLVNRQVSISVEEIGGKVAIPPTPQSNNTESLTEKNKLPPLILMSAEIPPTVPTLPKIKTEVNAKIETNITSTLNTIKPNHLAPTRQVTFQAASLSSVNAEYEARALVTKIKKQKLNAYIESTKNGQGIMVHRIKVGPFPTKSTQAVREQLETMGLKPFEIYHP